MTGLPPRTCRNGAATCRIRPRKAKTGRIPPMEHRANAHRAAPADARTGRAACQLRPERAKETHTLRSCCPCKADTRKTCAIPQAEKQVGPSARFKHHPTHPIEPHAHMPPARRAGRPTPLTPLQQERKKGHIPAMEHGRNQKGATSPPAAGRGRPTHLSPPLQQERKRGTSPAMEHGRNQKAETSPPDGAKKGWENMKSGH